MDAIEAIRGRRSIRRFRNRPVSRDLIEEIIRDAASAPYSFVSLPQPWLFAVVQGRDRIARYGEIAKSYARDHRPQVKNYEWADRPDFSVFHGAPALLIICGREGNPEGRGECERAGQNVALSAHARGLGSCWVGSPNLWLGDPATRAELDIPKGFIPHVVCVLGYPAHRPDPPRLIAPRIIWTGSGGGLDA